MATNQYTKPTTLPRWASTTSNIAEPSSGEKDAGWVLGGEHSSAYENWLSKSRGDWILWFNERFADDTDIDRIKITSGVRIDASGVATTNMPGLTVLGGKGASQAIFARGSILTASGDGTDAGYFRGGNANAAGIGGAALDCEGGIAAGNFDGGTCIKAVGGRGEGSGDGGIAVLATAGEGGSSGETGVAIHAVSTVDDGNHAVVAESTAAAPAYSAIRVVPQDADPTNGAEGDIFTTSSSHTDGAGHLKKYHGGDFRHVGVQAWAHITNTAGGSVTVDNNIGITSAALQSGNTEIRLTFDKAFSGTEYTVTGCSMQGQPFFASCINPTTGYCDIRLYSVVTQALVDFSSTTAKFAVQICGD